MKLKTHKIALFGMLIAAAFLFSYLESMLPIFLGIPGMKPGLANSVVLTSLYYLGSWDALFLSVVRVVLSGITFGNMYSLLYSLSGALLSFVVMLLLKRCKRFSMTGVSAAGGVMHNLGQILVAFVVLGDAVWYYFPFLLVSGTLTGCLIGMVSGAILKRIKPGI